MSKYKVTLWIIKSCGSILCFLPQLFVWSRQGPLMKDPLIYLPLAALFTYSPYQWMSGRCMLWRPLAWPLIFMLSLVGAFKEQSQKICFFSSHLPMTNHKGSQSPYQPLWRTKCFIVSDYAAHRQHGKQSLISVRSLARHVPSQVLGRTTVVICESEEDHIEDGKVKHGDRVDYWGKTWLFRHHLGWVLCLSHIFALRLWRNVQIFSIRLWNYSSSSWHLRDNWQYTWSHILKITVGINSYIHMKQNFHWKMGFYFHFSQKLRLGGGGWPFC